MTIQHKLIPDAERHEPIGASTATAGTVYVSDGTGSGSWITPQLEGQDASLLGQILKADGNGGYNFKHSPEGWGYYKDNGTDQTVSATAIKLSIDILGATTNTDYLPYQIRGVSQLWDSLNDKITPVTIGDSYAVRVDLPITAKTGSPTEFQIELDIGGGATPTIVINADYLPTSGTVPYTITFNFVLFSLATFKTNGGQLFVKTDTGTVTVAKPAIFISRLTAGDF